MQLITIDIKSEKQSVAEAIAQFEIEAEAYKKGGFKVMKVIHGYGSHGVGGAIRTEFLKKCEQLKRQKKLYDYIPGDKWLTKSIAKTMAINYCADLLADKELHFVNPGCTIVLL